MGVSRIKQDSNVAEYSSGRVRELPEFQEALAEAQKGLRTGEQIEVIISPKNASKLRLKRPATSALHALQRQLKGQYVIFQRAVKGEPWPRIYISAQQVITAARNGKRAKL